MGVEIPKKFDLPGLFHFIAQLVGATYKKIRAQIVKRLGPRGEAIVSKLESTFALVKDLATRGPIALWERVKGMLTNLKEMIFPQVTQLVITEIIKSAVTKLVSMLNPAGAIIQAVLAIYRVVSFFLNWWDTIKELVQAILDTITTVALGQIGKAANFIEKVMVKGMKLVIAFLARVFGLGGIATKVKKLIDKIAAPVRKAIGMVVGWIVKQAKKLFKKLKIGAKKVKEKLVQWWKARKKFKDDEGKTHTLFFKGKMKSAKLMVASSSETVEQYIKDKENELKKIGKFQRANTIVGKIKTITRKDVNRTQARQITKFLSELGNIFLLLGRGTIEDLPSEKEVRWFGRSNVELLSSKTSKGGTRATADIPGWSLLQRLGLTAKNDRWVKMHMISQRIGGKGDDPKNLIPVPNSVNTGSQVRSFETSVENLVEKRSKNKPNVAWISTRILKYHPQRQQSPSYKDNTFVKTLSMKSGLHFFKKKNKKAEWVKDKTVRIKEQIEIRKPDSDFAKAKKPSLSKPSTTQMHRLDPLLTRAFVRWVRVVLSKRAHKPFNDFTDFKTSMQNEVPQKIWNGKWKFKIIPALKILIKQKKIKVK
jgi:hypothetical protein